MGVYRVVSKLIVVANNPLEAAMTVRAIQRDPTSVQGLFRVSDGYRDDLIDLPPDPQRALPALPGRAVPNEPPASLRKQTRRRGTRKPELVDHVRQVLQDEGVDLTVEQVLEQLRARGLVPTANDPAAGGADHHRQAGHQRRPGPPGRQRPVPVLASDHFGEPSSNGAGG